MAKKKKEPEKKMAPKSNAYIEGAGTVIEEPITVTLEKNYMPYAVSVIVSRAFPEIDGFKPSHRKLLYTMYSMGLLKGNLTKSANIVGQTMKLNPHGDGAIYETMVRLTRGNEALLHPYILSKGNFGKAYSRDMAYAAHRYTEAKLEPICNELFKEIERDTVDFVPNFDNTLMEPTLLPVTFPSILVNANVGIGVSMASAICPFNLSEVCETTISLMRNPEFNALETLKGPDFAGGAFMIYDEEELDRIYRTGRGSVKIRAKYNYDKSSNCIEITEIPSTTTIEAIIEKVIALVKAGKIREITAIRDETDLNGLKITIDLKRGIDADKFMNKLYKLTPLQDTYSCNFNLLINGYPKVLGVYDIIDEWVKFRKNCIKRGVAFDLKKKKDKLHLLKGLEKILLDIDKAVKIVRETEEEAEVVPNLMIGFSIDEIQAEYVAEIKLRHLNREHILRRTAEIKELIAEIEDLEDILGSERRVKSLIIEQLKEVSKKYGQPRKTMIISAVEEESEAEEEIPDYPCKFFLSRSGYFKKITPQSLRMSDVQKFKEGDELMLEIEGTNKTELLFFTDKATVYKAKASQFESTKASAMGDYIAATLGFEDSENVRTMITTTDYSGYLVFFFENGKAAKVPLNAYETKTNRKKLTNAYSAQSKLVNIVYVSDNDFVMTRSSNGRAIIFNTAMVSPKAKRDTIGVQVMSLKTKGSVLEKAYVVDEATVKELSKFKVKNIPSAGCFAKDIEDPDQITLGD